MREVNRRPGTALPLSRHSPADPPTSIRHNKIVLSSWDKERFLKIQRQLHLISEGEVLLSTPRDLVQEGVDIPEQEHAEGQDEKQEEIRKKLPVEDLRNPVERNLQRSQTVGRIKNRSAKRHLASCLSGDVPKTLRLSSSVAFLPRHAIRDRRFYRLNKENSWNNIWRIPACRQKYATCESRNQDAIEYIDARFRREYGEHLHEERRCKERHDQILAHFRVQRLQNYSRQLQCSPGDSGDACVDRSGAAAMPVEAAQRQLQVATELARPRERRNHPEKAACDMDEYRGLVVGNDLEYFGKAYEVRNAAFSYAQEIYSSLLQPVGREQQPATLIKEVHKTGHRHTESSHRIALMSRRDLSDFETRILTKANARNDGNLATG